jgi:hypothetical protein
MGMIVGFGKRIINIDEKRCSFYKNKKLKASRKLRFVLNVQIVLAVGIVFNFVRNKNFCSPKQNIFISNIKY